MADIRKTLPMLKQEWAGCEKCSLSIHRETERGHIVFGEGRQRGILFLGEGPGQNEERVGKPFVGKSGDLLRAILAKYEVTNYYITNVVACRSCVPLTDAAGNTMFTNSYNRQPARIRYKDQAPSKESIQACAARVYEEIYMADPVLIVAMGAPAASFLSGSSEKITQIRGAPVEISIPGAGHKASFSAKKHEWLRKVKGQLVLPTVQSEARYVMIPTFHPAFVLRQLHDEALGNPYEKFARDLWLAKTIYNRYYEEVAGIAPEDYELEAPGFEVPKEIAEEIIAADAAARNYYEQE